MKKTTKFGALLFGLILAVGSLVGCGGNNTTTSTQSSLTPEEKTAIVEGAGSYVWSTYFTTKPTVKTGSFDVVKRTRYNGVEVQVSWALEITSGSNENGGIEYRTSNDVNFDTVYVGYYDGKVIEDMEYKLTPTFTLDDVTLRMDQIVEPEKAFFSYETPAFVLSGREAWDLNDKSTLNIKGVVLDVIGEGSSSAGSFYMQDSEGYGYYMYKPDAKTEKPVAGNVIAATGKRSDYSGQQEFGAGGTVHIYTGETQQIMVHDATEDFQAAASNKDFDPKYQNNYVTLHGCIPQAHKGEDSYYYFTVGNGKARYNIYDSYYFLSDEQREAFKTAWDEAVANGSTIDITGISTVYSGAIQIYGSTNYPQIFEVTGQMTDENKVDATLDEVRGVLAETYSAAAEVELPTHGTLFPTVALTWEVVAPEDETKVKIEENTLKILDIDGSFDEIKVKATATLGEASKDIVLESKTKLEITTIAEFLENKDAENVQYLQGFVVAANGSHTKAGSFVLYDGTGSIFSYNSLEVEFGDEIVVSAKFATNGNNKFPQLGTISLVKKVSEGNAVKGELAYEFGDIADWRTEYNADESENHTAFTAKYANQFVKFTGYLLQYTYNNKEYVGVFNDSESTATTNQVANLYSGTDLKTSELLGQEVDVYGFIRGVGANYPTLQVQAVVAKGTDYFGDSVTVTKTMAELAEEFSWENAGQYLSWALDENITVSATATDTNTGKYYTNGNSWRLYRSGSAQITITAASGYTIKSVTITFGGTNVIDSITSGEAITVNATSWTSEAMASTNSSSRADVTSITVVYEAL